MYIKSNYVIIIGRNTWRNVLYTQMKLQPLACDWITFVLKIKLLPKTIPEQQESIGTLAVHLLLEMLVFLKYYQPYMNPNPCNRPPLQVSSST